MIEPACRAILVNAPAVTNIVAGRVHHGGIRPPSETAPAVVMQLISHPREHTFDGPAKWSSGRMQLDCWARGYKQAKELKAAVVATVDGYEGTIENVTIGYLEIDGEQDKPPIVQDGEPTPDQWGVSLDMRFLILG